MKNDLSISGVPIKSSKSDSITEWGNLYFEHEVTTAESTRKVQVRDIGYFIRFMIDYTGEDLHKDWTSRLSRKFVSFLKKEPLNNKRRWSDRSVNRIIANVKTFAKWIHKHRPFSLGNPMAKIKTISHTNSLEIERALTRSERNKLLDAADQLHVAKRSSDRRRNKDVLPDERKLHKNARPWRNRAIIYAIIETGMRREAVCRMKIDDINIDDCIIKVIEKGGHTQLYPISDEGMNAIVDYINSDERKYDTERYGNDEYLFCSAYNTGASGQMKPRQINRVWDEVCQLAGVDERTPHSARHGMGVYIMDKTGNVAAVQRQLGHTNAAYSMQYSRIGNKELKDLLNNRNNDEKEKK